MFGKGALIFVFGFALAFSTYSIKLNSLIVRSVDNVNFAYVDQQVREASNTAINFGIHEYWLNLEEAVDSFTIIAPPCTSFVQIIIGEDSTIVKVTTRSRVFQDEYYSETGEVYEFIDSLFAVFTYATPLSEYFWFTNNEAGAKWAAGDTAWGKVHTNGIFKTIDNPAFYGKVTAGGGISPDPLKPNNDADYFGGWEVGIDLAIPSDMSDMTEAAISSNAGAPANTKCIYTLELTLHFLSDGTVVRTVDGVTDTVAITTIAPDGIITCSTDIHVSGTLNGMLTLYSAADIMIVDDILYAVDPRDDINSDDLLGLIAENDVSIKDNDPNNDNAIVHACMLAITGSFTAENAGVRDDAGTLTVLGSISQNTRGVIGSPSYQHGFEENYFYDPRLLEISPPLYPYVKEPRLSSWWE